MKFYLCAPTALSEEMEAHALDLVILKHTVTSRWHKGILGSPRLELDDPAIKQRAIDDAFDITTSDILIAFSSTGGRGGRHWELGFAYGCSAATWLVGDIEHAFHTLVSRQYKTWDECLAFIQKTLT